VTTGTLTATSLRSGCMSTQPAITDTSPVRQGYAEGGYQLITKPNDIVHLVCCRETSWGTAFCGEPTSREINMDIQRPCTMCVEQAEAMLPGCSTSEENLCPVDGNPCPDEHEINLRIAEATDQT
jgi:hypothetical protein